MNWKLIIFDCDGILVDSEPIASRIFTELLNEIGLRISCEQTKAEFTGHTTAKCLEIVESRLGRAVPSGFVEKYMSRLFQAFKRELKPIPGIVSALDRIRVPACVASNGPHEKMRLTLGLTGLLPRFEGRMFSAIDVERGKPHPDLFLYAARSMDCAPESCVVVEDSVFGVRAALAAGMTAFGFAGEADPAILADAGANVFREMNELPGLLESAKNGNHEIR